MPYSVCAAGRRVVLSSDEASSHEEAAIKGVDLILHGMLSFEEVAIVGDTQTHDVKRIRVTRKLPSVS